MSAPFAGRVAIVTGGSDGIGRATSELLAAKGAHVVVLARSMDKLEATRDAIIAEGGSVEIHSIDLSDAQAYADLVARIADAHGRLDMLVNNAMSVHYAPLDKLSLDHWRKDFAVNADAVFAGTKAAIAAMRKVGGGSIVNVSSTTAIRAAPFMTSYSASKAAMIQFSAVAAMEVARDNIRVNCVVPGQVQTAGNEDFARKAPEIAAKTAQAIPMGRGGKPDELAEAIVFLLSDAAAYITGVALPVDGGKSAQLYLPS
ncbi:MAG: SDR family NAD(P)-dependent oxidoreductase [Erythrobacter sp.]|uniref:SDR family NAD(P)-dependent oxidoreductase n=1 Tax=Erythrobacter sp. TaxID=1042 RepID=UPI003A8C4AB8